MLPTNQSGDKCYATLKPGHLKTVFKQPHCHDTVTFSIICYLDWLVASCVRHMLSRECQVPLKMVPDPFMRVLPKSKGYEQHSRVPSPEVEAEPRSPLLI